MLLREPPGDRRHVPHDRLLCGGSGGRLVVPWNIQRLRLLAGTSAGTIARRGGREQPVAPLEIAVFAAASYQFDHLPQSIFQDGPRFAPEARRVGDPAAGGGNVARQEKLDHRRDDRITADHVRTGRRAEFRHRRVEPAAAGIDRHVAARHRQAERPPCRGVEPAGRGPHLHHQRIPFETDLRAALVNQREAGDRFDRHLDRHSRRLADPGVPDGPGEGQLAAERRRLVASRLVTNQRQADGRRQPRVRRQRDIEPALAASRQQAHVRVAHRQPTGLIAIGQRREQEAVCRRQEQPRGCRSAGGRTARRAGHVQHQVVAAGDRLLQPVLNAEHRGLFAGQWPGEGHGRRIFLEVEPGHRCPGIGGIFVKLDLVPDKATRTPQAFTPGESITVMDRLAELDAQVGHEIPFGRLAFGWHLDATQHRRWRQVMNRHHEIDGACAGPQRDIEHAADDPRTIRGRGPCRGRAGPGQSPGRPPIGKRQCDREISLLAKEPGDGHMDAMDRDGIAGGRAVRFPDRLFERHRSPVAGQPGGRDSFVGMLYLPRHRVTRRLLFREKPHQPRLGFVGQPRDLDRSCLESRPFGDVEHEPLDPVGGFDAGLHLSFGEPRPLERQHRLAHDRRDECLA